MTVQLVTLALIAVLGLAGTVGAISTILRSQSSSRRRLGVFLLTFNVLWLLGAAAAGPQLISPASPASTELSSTIAA